MSDRAVVRWCGGYDPGRRVCEALGYDMITGVKHLTRTGRRMNRRAVVFNFGHSGVTAELANCERLVNPGFAVGNAVNKISSFLLFDTAGVPTPAWTDDQDVAQGWVDRGVTVFCRKKVNGLGGLDIVLALPGAGVPEAPLYTAHLGTHMIEYRAHVFNGEVLVRQQKKRMGSEKRAKKGIRKVDEFIRVHNKGWVFAERDIAWPRGADELCAKAVKALGLDFGTVDFQANPLCEHGEDMYVLEVNTAPGMENRNTFDKYLDAMRRTQP